MVLIFTVDFVQVVMVIQINNCVNWGFDTILLLILKLKGSMAL